jgi:penicillin-binding protein 1A
MIKKILLTTFVLGFIFLLAGAGFLMWGYFYITRDLPRLNRIEDYNPAAVSRVVSADGQLVGEFFQERRYPVKLDEVPLVIRNAFLAAEDVSFYQHPGIDFLSILRAFYINLQRGRVAQGGSTITQQIVKNLLLTPEQTIERKIKEAILAYQIEQNFSKDEIFEIYLNQIFFGNTSYGIKSASRTYFRKELDELSLAEAAILAGLPQAPSRYSPISHFQRAKRRQRYVLTQMVRAGFISEQEAREAAAQELKIFPASLQNFHHAPYYLAELRRVFVERFPQYELDIDGLTIHTAVDVEATSLAERALQRGLREVDKRQGWRGPIDHVKNANVEDFYERFPSCPILEGAVYPAMIIAVLGRSVDIVCGKSNFTLDLSNASWAKVRISDEGRRVNREPWRDLVKGDVIEVSFTKKTSQTQSEELTPALDQTPELEGAIVLLDPHSGRVVSLIGGYNFRRSVFNRATQAMRQPGSAFKPLVYLAAIEAFQYSAATIVKDEPRTFRVGSDLWSPGNYDKQFQGPMTLRTSLERSRNIVSADITARIGVDAVINYASRLGIQSRLGRNLSLSLGSSEVTVLELTRAYGVFAAKGVLFNSTFITRIEDRSGNVLYRHEDERLATAKRVINENSAFIMANMMKGVVESGTAQVIKGLGRPSAGKTGTSNDLMDAWYIGFTPDWVAGVWVGFDQKKNIGRNETGGRVAAPIWLDFMKGFLESQDARHRTRLLEEAKQEAKRLGIDYFEPEAQGVLDFSPPDGVDPYWINKETGMLSTPGAAGAIQEYFIRGTEPSRSDDSIEAEPSSYLESPYL